MKKLHCYNAGHSDFRLQWDNDFEGSVSTHNKFSDGSVQVRYSDAPKLLYDLGKRVNNFGFLSKKDIGEILGSETIGFASTDINDYRIFSKRIDGDTDFYRFFWKPDLPAGKTKSERKSWEVSIRSRRDNTNITDIVETLEAKRTNPRKLDYAGVVVPGGQEFDSYVHFLSSPAGNTYICQRWNGMNIAKLNDDHVKGVIKEMVRMYGGVVSVALRSLLEK
jgi:hypothetical protein